jgi:hypothetical protein
MVPFPSTWTVLSPEKQKTFPSTVWEGEVGGGVGGGGGGGGGGAAGDTKTVCVKIAEFPHLSVAVHVNTVVPPQT